MSHRGQEKSIVWEFFTVNAEDPSRVTCNLCDNSVSRGGKNETKKKAYTTTNMNKHLKSKHQAELKEKEDELKEEKEAKEDKKRRSMTDFVTVSTSKKLKGENQPSSSHSSQITLQETVERSKKWDINHEKARKIHVAIGEMMALDVQPFSIVEDIGFNRLMHLLKPNYEIPSRKYFTTNIIPELHSTVMAKVQLNIDSATNISFTTDIWTNNADASFIR